jgi:hypothetical protein
MHKTLKGQRVPALKKVLPDYIVNCLLLRSVIHEHGISGPQNKYILAN